MKYFKLKYFISFLFFVVIFLPTYVSAMGISINIPDKYSEVKAGERVYFETEVKWPENTGRKDLRIEYSILDKNNYEVTYMKVLKAIETQASFMDSMSIPSNTTPGLYKIHVNISDYEDLSYEVAASFNVLKSANDIMIYIYIIYVIIGLLGIILILALSEILHLLRKKIR